MSSLKELLIKYKDVFAWMYKYPLWENYGFCNWGYNCNFELYPTFTTLGIYIARVLSHKLQELHRTP